VLLGPDEADIVLNLDYWGTAHWFMTHGSIYNYVESFGGFGNVNAVATNYSSSKYCSFFYTSPVLTRVRCQFLHAFGYCNFRFPP
jgi:hypothetical protein